MQIYTGESINSHYDLDLNNDGIVDFIIYAHSLTYSPYWTVDRYVSAKPVNSNAIEKAGGLYAMPVDCSEIIGDQVNFDYSTLELIGIYASASGSAATEYWGWWMDETMPHLLGLKLIVNSDTLYGWVRLQVADQGKFEVFDYAYNSTPNQEITGCDTSSFATSASVTNEIKSSITAFVNADNLTAIVSDNLLPTTLRVMNMLGEPILSKEIIEEKNEINLSNFPAGIYLVTIGDGKSAWSRKIVLSR